MNKQRVFHLNLGEDLMSSRERIRNSTFHSKGQRRYIWAVSTHKRLFRKLHKLRATFGAKSRVFVECSVFHAL